MEKEETIINGVKVIKDGDITHFVPVEDDKREDENLSWFGKIWKWFTTSKVTPYVKVRDAADPFEDRTDTDAGSDGKIGIEGGVKITF